MEYFCLWPKPFFLIRNSTHRPTVATAVAAHEAIARTEAQVPSVARVKSIERRTPNVAVVAYIVH